MTEQTCIANQRHTVNDTAVEDDNIDTEWWLKDIKHRIECNQCEHAYYVHSEGTWYCKYSHKLTEGYCEY